MKFSVMEFTRPNLQKDLAKMLCLACLLESKMTINENLLVIVYSIKKIKSSLQVLLRKTIWLVLVKCIIRWDHGVLGSWRDLAH